MVNDVIIIHLANLSIHHNGIPECKKLESMYQNPLPYLLSSQEHIPREYSGMACTLCSPVLQIL
jgi:hypothetical protein